MNSQQHSWDEIGELDPLWAVLSDPVKRHNRWDESEFFATGESEINDLLATALQWHLPVLRLCALDYGCGVGRLTRALGARFEQAVGVDISPVMLAKARAFNRAQGQCTFELLGPAGLSAFSDGVFDLIYSHLVLQHIPDRGEIESIIGEFVRILRPGGILVFQLPSAFPPIRRIQVRPRVFAVLRRMGVPAGVLYRLLHLHPIRMTGVAEERVSQILTGRGARILRVDRSLIGATKLQNRIYYATVDPSSASLAPNL